MNSLPPPTGELSQAPVSSSPIARPTIFSSDTGPARLIIPRRRSAPSISDRLTSLTGSPMGLGHIRRNLSIARSITESLQASVLLISGTKEASVFSLPPGCECLCLPALEKNLGGHYRSRRLDVDLSQLIGLRAATIRAALGAGTAARILWSLVICLQRRTAGIHRLQS